MTSHEKILGKVNQELMRLKFKRDYVYYSGVDTPSKPNGSLDEAITRYNQMQRWWENGKKNRSQLKHVKTFHEKTIKVKKRDGKWVILGKVKKKWIGDIPREEALRLMEITQNEAPASFKHDKNDWEYDLNWIMIEGFRARFPNDFNQQDELEFKKMHWKRVDKRLDTYMITPRKRDDPDLAKEFEEWFKKWREIKE